MNVMYRDGKVFYRDSLSGVLQFVRYMDEVDFKIQREPFQRIQRRRLLDEL